jgi:hypothetical protein
MVEFKFHYGPLGYLKLMFGGTPIPISIDVFRKLDHKFVKTIKDKSLLDGLADGL